MDFKVEKEIRDHLVVGKKLENSAWHVAGTWYFDRRKLRDYMICLNEQSSLEAEIITTNDSFFLVETAGLINMYTPNFYSY